MYFTSNDEKIPETRAKGGVVSVWGEVKDAFWFGPPLSDSVLARAGGSFPLLRTFQPRVPQHQHIFLLTLR
jgi:hypothetical protein